jgi:CIC family chloride channel protein
MNKLKLYLRWLFARFIVLPPRYIVLLLAFIIGLSTGLIAVILKNLVHVTHVFIINSLNVDSGNLLYFALPLIGILVTVLYIRFFVKDDISHGISKVLYAISKGNGRIKSHNNYSSVIASTLTVAFGGSVGLEAPVVLTGGSIGSNLARIFGQNYKTTILLIACGAAGAIASIFKAPIAAVFFAFEVLMIDLTMWSIIPLLVSAASASFVSYFLLGNQVTFSFSLQDPYPLRNILLYILLGIFCGLVSRYFYVGSQWVEQKMRSIENVFKRILIGGTLLGLLIYFFPPLYGEGYDTLRLILTGQGDSMLNGSIFYSFHQNEWVLMLFVLMVIFFKMFASSLTTASGGIGGWFAPSLFLGGVVGFFSARIFSYIPGFTVSEKNFALVGMAGILSGIMHAPLTAIFLIAEITGGYSLLLPLMVTSVIAYLTIYYFDTHSVYTRQLASQNALMTHNKDKAVLLMMKLEPLIERDLETVMPGDTLGHLVKLVKMSKRNIFPVIDENRRLLGAVSLDDIREKMFDGEEYHTVFVRDLMIPVPDKIQLSDNMQVVLDKFEQSGAWNLPVEESGVYIGFVSKAKIYNVYRKLLVEFSEE